MNVGLIYLALMVVIAVLLWIKRDKIKIEPILYIPSKYGIECELRKKDDKGEYKPYKKKVIPILFIVLYKTKIGIKFIDRLLYKKIYSNVLKKTLKWMGYISIGVCFLTAIAMIGALIYFLWLKFSAPELVPTAGVMFVLPFKIKGQIYVPFLYWIISVFIIATVHEFGHAIIARLNNVPIDYTGPAFLSLLIPLVPAAFVLPNEKVMKKTSKGKQLSIIAVGPFFNILLGVICGIVLLLFCRKFRKQRLWLGKILALEEGNRLGR